MWTNEVIFSEGDLQAVVDGTSEDYYDFLESEYMGDSEERAKHVKKMIERLNAELEYLRNYEYV